MYQVPSCLKKEAESSLQDEPTCWWKPMFDGDITVRKPPMAQRYVMY
jgi:hypothetical protein